MVDTLCPHCGASYLPGSVFCSKCGKRLPQAAPSGVESAPQPVQEWQAPQAGQQVQPGYVPPPQQAPPVQPASPVPPQTPQPPYSQAAPSQPGAGNTGSAQDPYAPPAYAPVVQGQPEPHTGTVQQPYYGAPAAGVYPPQKNRSGRKNAIIAAIAIGVLAVVGLVLGLALSGILGGAADVDYYEIGGDRVPSVSLALGQERRVRSSDSSTGREMDTLTVEYSVSGDAQGDDMRAYFDYLCGKDDFTMMAEAGPDLFEASSASGVQAYRAAREEGYLIVVQADYDTRGYTITVMHGEGEVPGGTQTQSTPPQSLPPESTLPQSTLPQSTPPQSTPPDDPPQGGGGGLLPVEDPVSTNTVNGYEISSYADGTVAIGGDNVILTPDGRMFVNGEEFENRGMLAVPEGGTRINVNTCTVVLLGSDMYLVANGCVVYIEGGSTAYLYTEE